MTPNSAAHQPGSPKMTVPLEPGIVGGRGHSSDIFVIIIGNRRASIPFS